MTKAEILGHITLQISFWVYLFFLLPQLWRNFRRSSTEGLSWSMHVILLLAYGCDLVYGLGRGLQWEYKVVSLVGLCCLAIQHWQIYRYAIKGQAGRLCRWGFGGFTILGLLALSVLLGGFYFDCLPLRIFTILGFCSQCGWFCYSLPQIVLNFKHRSAAAISPMFVFLSIPANLCDCISAWALDWPLPSKLGAPLLLLIKVILLWQCYHYNRETSSNQET